MIVYDVLQSLGLNKKEQEVYIACLGEGVSVAHIAQKTTIGRTQIYDLVENLVARGFLRQVVKEKKKIFFARSPKELLRMQEEKIEHFREALPEFDALMQDEFQKPRISYYEKESGIERVNEQLHFDGGEVLVITDEDFYALQEGLYKKKNIEKRLQAGTKIRSLGGMSTAAMESRTKDEEEKRETRLFPQDIFDPKVMIGIYKNKTFVLNHKKQFGYVIEDKEFSHTLQQLFEIAWSSGRIVK